MSKKKWSKPEIRGPFDILGLGESRGAGEALRREQTAPDPVGMIRAGWASVERDWEAWQGRLREQCEPGDDKKGGESHWGAQAKSQAWDRAISGVIESWHGSQWTASDNPLTPSLYGVARHDVNKGDMLTINLWEKHAPTVAEKWAPSVAPLIPVEATTATLDGPRPIEYGDTLTVDFDPRPPTVAEKWAEKICDRIDTAQCMIDTAEDAVDLYRWVEARGHLLAARDEIDKALSEIEPLAVEQGGAE